MLTTNRAPGKTQLPSPTTPLVLRNSGFALCAGGFVVRLVTEGHQQFPSWIFLGLIAAGILLILLAGAMGALFPPRVGMRFMGSILIGEGILQASSDRRIEALNAHLAIVAAKHSTTIDPISPDPIWVPAVSIAIGLGIILWAQFGRSESLT